MGSFKHDFAQRLAEELKTREKMLEDHSVKGALKAGNSHRIELDRLKGELDAVSRKLEHFERSPEADWEKTRATLHTDLESLDKDIRSWLEKTG